jgi:hypothetical protein
LFADLPILARFVQVKLCAVTLQKLLAIGAAGVVVALGTKVSHHGKTVIAIGHVTNEPATQIASAV